MSNTTLTADIIAKEAVAILENELVMANLVHRGHESEFGKSVNGYTVGDTISIRKPADFTVRDGAVATVQDVVEAAGDFLAVARDERHCGPFIQQSDGRRGLRRVRRRRSGTRRARRRCAAAARATTARSDGRSTRPSRTWSGADRACA